MLLNSAHSDRTGERPLHCIVPCLVMGAAFLVASYVHQSWVVVVSLGAAVLAISALQGPSLAVNTQFLAGRAAAAGVAAISAFATLGGFVGPYWMGVMKDATGNYRARIRGLVLPCPAAAVCMHLLTRSLARLRCGQVSDIPT